MSKEFKEKFFTTLCAASLFSLTIFLFGPLHLYFTNILEFPYLFSDVWYLFLFISFLSILLISTALLLLKHSMHQVAVSILFAFAFLLWLQGNILVWNYGLLDGKDIRWNDFKVYGFIDTAVWLSFLTIAFIKRAYIYKITKNISLGLMLIQVISLSIAWFQAPEQPDWKKYTFSEESKFSFSSEKNVIILVLDTFQSDIFQELANEHPEYREIFKGFTYFRNAVGGYPTTYPSIPLILTGQYYDNSIPIQDFIRNAYSSLSIPLTLKRNDFQVDLFPAASNTVQTNGIFDRKNAIVQIYNITLFRYMPHFMKKDFFKMANESIVPDLDFLKNMKSGSKATSERNTFKFFHLTGVHPPFQLNERLEREELEYNRIGYKIQAKAALEITSNLLTTLKKIGTYDNSMIFVVGDHGLGSFGINVRASGYSDNMTSTNIIASAIPLILVKPFESTEDMKISDTPVSLSDIPKTIVSELNLEDDYPGCSIFSIRETDHRERRFLAYNWEHEYWNKEFLPAMQEYIVTGFSWLNQSWKPTYRKFTSEGVQNTQPPTYQYGSEIQFGVGGNAERYQWWGWSGPEEGFTWTDGKNASLAIPINQPQSDLTLDAILTPLVSDKLDKQRVNIYANGKKLDELTLTAGGEYKIEIPKNLINGSSLEISFELPDATSPSELQVSEDSRILGIAVQSIMLLEKN